MAPCLAKDWGLPSLGYGGQYTTSEDEACRKRYTIRLEQPRRYGSAGAPVVNRHIRFSRPLYLSLTHCVEMCSYVDKKKTS